MKIKNKKYIYLALNETFNGNIREIFNKYYDDKLYKNKKMMDKLLYKGKEFSELLDQKEIKFLNVANQTIKINTSKRDIVTLYLKGDTSLLAKREIKVMNGLTYFKDIDELNRIIKSDSKRYTLLFKERELRKEIIVPDGSIFFIDDDFILKVPNYISTNLYVSGVPYFVNKKGYEYTQYLTILIEWLFVKEGLINEVYFKQLTEHYTSEEAFECEALNVNYEVMTTSLDRRDVYPSIRSTFLVK